MEWKILCIGRTLSVSALISKWLDRPNERPTTINSGAVLKEQERQKKKWASNALSLPLSLSLSLSLSLLLSLSLSLSLSLFLSFSLFQSHLWSAAED
jgi:hypothetical protein